MENLTYDPRDFDEYERDHVDADTGCPECYSDAEPDVTPADPTNYWVEEVACVDCGHVVRCHLTAEQRGRRSTR